jgi:hypothetical protein
VSLQKLSLEWNQIGDLEPLSQLVSLHELRLHHNQIGDIEPLMALNMLNSLSVTGNPIKILLQSITNLPMEIQWKDRSYGESGFITFFDRYEALCQECGVTDQGRRKTLLGYLNSLGVVLFFEELDFADIYVLDPHWVTVGVYRVINSSKTKGGTLAVSDLDYILNEEKIKSEEYDPASENFFVLQGLFSNLRQDMLEEAELEVKDENERKRLQRDLLNAEGAFTEMEHAIAAGQKALNPSVKERLGDFIENLADEHSRLSKGIKLLTKGAEKARKLAGYYNTCAPFFGLPSVPPVLLGK